MNIENKRGKVNRNMKFVRQMSKLLPSEKANSLTKLRTCPSYIMEPSVCSHQKYSTLIAAFAFAGYWNSIVLAALLRRSLHTMMLP